MVKLYFLVIKEITICRDGVFCMCPHRFRSWLPVGSGGGGDGYPANYNEVRSS